MRTGKRKIFFWVLAVIVFVIAGASACSVHAKAGSTSIKDTGIPDATTAEMPTLTPTPTVKPTPTPTPTPASVYIPRETLPEGQLLETGYYAVLPGEGAFCNVYDCFGKQIDSFLFTNGRVIRPLVYLRRSNSRRTGDAIERKCRRLFR